MCANYVGLLPRVTSSAPVTIDKHKKHKKVNQVQATPDQLRQQSEGSMNISTSPLLDASREESCLNTDTSEEIKEPTPPRQPSTPPPSKPSPSPPVILRKPVRMLNGDPVFVKRK